MKQLAIIRTRGKILPETIRSLEILNLPFKVEKHPKNMTFAQFHNKLFSEAKSDTIYIMVDDDVYVNDGVFKMIDFLKNNSDYVMATGYSTPNNNKIKRVYQKCFIQPITFACCAIKGSFLNKVKMPDYLECSEDDYCRKVANKLNLKYKILNESFIHFSLDWNEKLLRGLRWHISNGRLHYENNGNKLDEICVFPYTNKGVKEFANRITKKVFQIDRKYALKVKQSILDGYFNYKKYLVNR